MNNWNLIMPTDEGVQYLLPNDLAKESHAHLKTIVHRECNHFAVNWL